MAFDEKGLKRFSGEDADDSGKQLRKFRSWAEAKLVTMKDISEKQKGPWIFTLLDGKALEAVEHLSLEDMMKETGAETIWGLLTARFPEKESEDQMGQALGEVFGVCARDAETMQQWSARVQEVFQKCVLKAKVEFPSQAKGWIALNCAGLSEEQKAIVKAKTQGKLDIEVVTAALRSCFPQFKANANKARRPVSTYLAEAEDAPPDDEVDDFQDVEAFLADHGLNVQGEDGETEEFQEEEATEALAISWKERRKEISKLQQRRGFRSQGSQAADQAKRSFRVEIEELKRRTRCRRCHRFGHWARECKAQLGNTSSSSTRAHVTSSDANLVQEEFAFVGTAEALEVEAKDTAEQLATGLVSSPGYGVVDSGCGRTLIGRHTLEAMTRLLTRKTDKVPEMYKAQSLFRFGNGATEESNLAVKIPVGIAGKMGLIDAAVIEGQAPLLLGRPTLERLNVILNFRDKSMRFLDSAEDVPMHTNPAGQLLINVLEFPSPGAMVQPSKCIQGCVGNERVSSPRSFSGMGIESQGCVLGSSVGCSSDKRVCVQGMSGTALDDRASQQDSTAVANTSTPNPRVHSSPTKVPSPVEPPPTPSSSSRPPRSRKKITLKQKECRRLLAQVKHHNCQRQSQTAVAELFCPPRFAEQARSQGATGLSFDIKQGCNLLDPNTQHEVSDILDKACPDLLVACPPCVHWGGWDHLNRLYRSPTERARLARIARLQVKYCVKEIHEQLKRGGHFLFEHPLGSAVWKLPELQALKRKYGLHRVDMCAFGLKCPDSNLPIQKATGLISSHPDIAQVTRRCPGCPQHKVIGGQCSQGPLSAYAGKYTPQFVEACWKPVC